MNMYQDRYEIPMFIVENGFGYADQFIDEHIHDQNRIDYLKAHIEEMKKAIEEDGILGLFTGGFTACAAGVSSALIFSYLASFFFRPKMKK